MRTSRFHLVGLGASLLAAGFVTSGVLADASRLSTSAADQSAYTIPSTLPAVDKTAQKITPGGTEAVSILSFDDGTCETGLGVGGAMVSSLVDFDVPTQCTTGGLDIIAMTARMNTGSANAIVLHQGGVSPNGIGAPDASFVANFAAQGPCATTGTPGPTNQVAITPGSLVVSGTSNFFAGLQNISFAARDSGASAGRIWLNCSTCGMTQYTPSTIAGLGLGGNWLIRVSVEDSQCPVELLGFDIE